VCGVPQVGGVGVHVPGLRVGGSESGGKDDGVPVIVASPRPGNRLAAHAATERVEGPPVLHHAQDRLCDACVLKGVEIALTFVALHIGLVVAVRHQLVVVGSFGGRELCPVPDAVRLQVADDDGAEAVIVVRSGGVDYVTV